MIRLLFLTFIIIRLNVYAQPIACKEDAHCDSGYFCEFNSHACRKCLSCYDLGREEPQSITLMDCIKLVDDCGPCFEGLVNDYTGDEKAKCVRPELEILKYFRDPFSFSCMAALIGFIVIVMFMILVYRTTIVIKVAEYSIPTPCPHQKIFNEKQLLGTHAF